MKKNSKRIFSGKNELTRKIPIPCKVCGILFSGRSYKRRNCDEHYQQKRPEVEAERIRLLKIAKTGKKRAPFSREWLQHLSDSAQHGSKSKNWKGGVTPVNERIRKSAEYVWWRKAVFERDNHTCQMCGKRGGNMHADHIKPFALNPGLRFELSNGRTLCVPCHRETPTYGRQAIYYATK